MRTRVWYGESVMNQLSSGLRNRDERIDIRECYSVIDQIINRLARESFLENWKLGFNGVDENFITRWEWLPITDPTDDGPSYFTSPATWVNLPKLQGINSVYFQNDFTAVTKKYFDTIHIMSQTDVQNLRNNLAGSLQGRLSVTPRGQNLYFNQGNVGTVYGQVGLALVIKDSSAISDSAPYPIPADIESRVIEEAVQYFLRRRATPADLVRDRVDKT